MTARFFTALLPLLLLPLLLLPVPLHALKSPASHVEEANQLFFRGRITKSIKSYKEAIKADPDHLPAYLNAAMAYRALTKNDEAAKMLEMATRIEPANVDIRSELGWLYYHENILSKARIDFSIALRINKKHPSSMLGMGATLLASGETERSVKLLKRLLKIRPMFTVVNFFLGMAHEKLEDLESSLSSYLEAIQRDWTFAESRTYLANVYNKLGRSTEAWKQYSKVISLDPRDSASRKALNKLSPKLPDKTKEPEPLERLPFTVVETIPVGPDVPIMKIGLWTSSRGRPPHIKKLGFEVSGPFAVVGTKTGKIYGKGIKGERWTAHYRNYRMSVIKTPDGEVLGPFKYGVRIQPLLPNVTIMIQEAYSMSGKSRKSVRGREYRGAMVITPGRRRGIYLISELNLEDYLLGVLPAEMPAAWPLEALKAQAVIARNYAFLRKKRYRPHRRYHYELCDSQHCQVYKGVSAEKDRCRLAVLKTKNTFLYHGEKLVQSYYHSNCGGHTQSSSEVPGWGNYSYLTGRPDTYSEMSSPTRTPWELNLWIKRDQEVHCNLPEYIPTSEFRWLRIIPKAALERKLNRKYRIGKLKAVIPLKRSRSGYVNELLIRGSRRRVVLRKSHKIRHYLGLQSLRSNLFLIETRKDADGKILEFWIYGGGWGHGIGMCQTGAAGMAERGKKKHGEILRFYYPNTEVH